MGDVKNKIDAKSYRKNKFTCLISKTEVAQIGIGISILRNNYLTFKGGRRLKIVTKFYRKN